MDEKEAIKYLAKYINQVEDTLEMMAKYRLNAVKNQALALRQLCTANNHTCTDKAVSVEMAGTLERQIWQIEKAINNIKRNTKKMKELTSANIPWEIYSKESWTEWSIYKVEKEQ